jgi:molybdate transport system ATP-binding protein
VTDHATAPADSHDAAGAAAPHHHAHPTGLTARLRLDLDRFRLDLALDVPAGHVVALIGPNGAGKSTTLRALAGLLPLREGRIALAGQTLDDPADGRFVPTEQRRIGMVFQDYLLFEHLSVLDNVAYGARARGTHRREARAEARRWLARMGLEEVADRRPRQLSGGQAQRVALARALATAPDLLLLDEPLAALDAGTRQEIRTDLRHHLREFPGCTVVVTHDPLDAMVLADTIVVVDGGRVVQQGPPREVALAPRTEYVARLVGLNLYRGTRVGAGGTVHLDDGGTLSTGTGTGTGTGTATGGTAAPEPVFVTFPPSAVALHRDRPAGGPRNVWRGRVDGLEQHADIVRVRLAAEPPVLADVTTAAVAELDLGIGREVWAAVEATEVRTYPA